MAFLFQRNKQKNNLELTRAVKDRTSRLGQEDKTTPKVRLHNHCAAIGGAHG
jgi:calcium binding protein 39